MNKKIVLVAAIVAGLVMTAPVQAGSRVCVMEGGKVVCTEGATGGSGLLSPLLSWLSRF